MLGEGVHTRKMQGFGSKGVVLSHCHVRGEILGTLEHKQRERPCWCMRVHQTISWHSLAREDARLQTPLPRGVMLVLMPREARPE